MNQNQKQRRTSFKDRTGHRNGRLTLLYTGDDIISGRGDPITTWVCQCDCGEFITVRVPSLWFKKSCGRCTPKVTSLIDFSGRRFGRVTVIDRAPNVIRPSGQNATAWNCLCDCGSLCALTSPRLKDTASCGCVPERNRLVNLVGRRFGKLTVIGEGPRGSTTRWFCKCDCGGEALALRSALQQETKTSCGCEKSQNSEHLLKAALRNRVRTALREQGARKHENTAELVGCSIEFLRTHIQNQFLPGMNWENWSTHGWHIDHIRPCASFILKDPDEQRRCFHFSNLQPMWAADNIRKGGKWNPVDAGQPRA